MSGLWEVVEQALRVRAQGRRAVLATVVKVCGSAYRRPGARMLMPDGGEPVGMVSGGCLESDLAERAKGVLASGETQSVVYDMRSPDDIVWGLGLGCNGEVRVLLEPLGPAPATDYLEFLNRCLRQRRPGVVVTLFDGRRLTLDEARNTEGSIDEPSLHAAAVEHARHALADQRSTVERIETGQGPVEALVEYVPPTISLLVFGAGNDAVPLVRLSRQLGWRVTVVDDRPAQARAERFPEADTVELIRFDALNPQTLPVDVYTPVVVMTHHFLHDLELLHYLLSTDTPYLGLLGPRQRSRNLLDELAKRGVKPTVEQSSRIYGPLGLDIGAETPEEIALATLAEIRAVLSRRQGGFLRDRTGPLHEWSQ